MGGPGREGAEWLKKGRLAALSGSLTYNECAGKCPHCSGEIKRKDAIVTAQFWRGLDKPADSGAGPRFPEGTTGSPGDTRLADFKEIGVGCGRLPNVEAIESEESISIKFAKWDQYQGVEDSTERVRR